MLRSGRLISTPSAQVPRREGRLRWLAKILHTASFVTTFAFLTLPHTNTSQSHTPSQLLPSAQLSLSHTSQLVSRQSHTSVCHDPTDARDSRARDTETETHMRAPAHHPSASPGDCIQYSLAKSHGGDRTHSRPSCKQARSPSPQSPPPLTAFSMSTTHHAPHSQHTARTHSHSGALPRTSSTVEAQGSR